MAPRDTCDASPVSSATSCIWIFVCLGLSWAAGLVCLFNALIFGGILEHLRCQCEAFAETKKADSGGEFWSESLSQLLHLRQQPDILLQYLLHVSSQETTTVDVFGVSRGAMWPVWCAQNNAIESSTKAYEVMGLMRRNWHVRGQRFLTEGEMRNKIEKIGQPTSHP